MFNITHYSLLISLFILFALCLLLNAEIRDRVVAFVDNKAITLSELDEIYKKTLKVTPDITKVEVLNTMINKALLLREAKKLRLEASSEDEMLREYINLRIRPFIRIKEEELIDFYEKHIKEFHNQEFEMVREKIETYLIEKEVNLRLKRHVEDLRKSAYIKIQLTVD